MMAFKSQFESLVSQFGEDVNATDTDAFYIAFYTFAVAFKVRSVCFNRCSN